LAISVRNLDDVRTGRKAKRKQLRSDLIPHRDAIRGSLLGLAVGDALGAPFEGTSPAHASAAVAGGLEMTGNQRWARGEWTDDTAMALALAESIGEHGLIDIDDVARRYIDWANRDGKGIGRATAHALLGARDAEEALGRARAYHESGGRAAGNGTVMRATPIALVTTDLIAARDAARRDAGLTHADESAAIASGALCALLIAVRNGRYPVGASVPTYVLGSPAVTAVLGAVQRREERVLADLVAGAEAGACWTTLGVALYAAENLDSYEQAMRWVIALGGDTDTNAAVAGALVGARDGVSAIPDRWLVALKDRERIERAAARLAAPARV
jgi:ADP-ribosyl-[dinitrogen reductase] hydrolase